MTAAPFGKILQLEWTDRDTDQPQNFDSERVEHAANLAILALPERDLDPGIFIAGTEEPTLRRSQFSELSSLDAPRHRLNHGTVGQGSDLNVVCLFNMGFGGGDMIRPFRIVR